MKVVCLVTATLAGATFLPAIGFSKGVGKGVSNDVGNHSAVPSQPQTLRNAQVRSPLTFEPNVGQAPSEIRWISRTPDRTFLLTGTDAVMQLSDGEQSSTVRMRILGATSAPATEGLDRLQSTTNYFLGKDRSAWRTGVPNYARVRYNNVYPGIDVIYYSNDRRLEYDFVLKPGADPGRIELAYEGADRMRLEKNGDLVIEVAGRTLRQLRPKVYQRVNGREQEVAAEYRISTGNRVQFALARYDRSRELVIDPVVQYSTYLGQQGRDIALSAATDRGGDIYIAGHTTSLGLPSLKAQQIPGGNSDAFVARYTGGGDLVWTTYIGGTGFDIAQGLALDSSGNVYVVGTTASPDFPMRSPAFGDFKGVYDAFLTKVSNSGQDFLYSTYLGGSGYDHAYAVANDAEGNTYVAGQTLSLDFPLRGAFQTGPSGGGGDTFVTKIATARQGLIYSTYVGGSGVDVATDIAVDSQGNAYVTGNTSSAVFPVVAPIQGTLRGSKDGFLYKLNARGSELLYSTFLGGSGDDVSFRVAVDPQGAAYLTGYTGSSDFPVRNAFQTALGGKLDAFVAKVNPEGSALVYSSFLGGSEDDVGFGGIIVDAGGTAYVSGYTASSNFPARNGLQASYGGGRYDAFVARVAPQGNSLVYSTLLGGSGQDEARGLTLDPQGQVILIGGTSSGNFPLAKNSYTALGGEFDVFLARLSADTSINFISSNLPALSFSVRPGVDPGSQTISLSAAAAPLTFTASSNQPWVKVSQSANTTPATVTVSLDRALIPTGTLPASEITINAPAAANSPLSIPVNLSVVAAPQITSMSPNPVTRGAEDLLLTLTGTGFQNGLSVRVNGNVVSSRFVNATTVEVTLPGTVRSTSESLQFIIFNPGPDATQSPVFQASFASATPVISQGGIVNAASGVPGAISPGEIIVIYGSGFGPSAPAQAAFVEGVLPTTVAETRVLVDGVAAPMLYSAPNQVSAVVPYSVLGRGTVEFEVEYRGQKSAKVAATVGPAAPGLFTTNARGSGQAVAYNANGSQNTEANPATIGSIVSLFGTGEGLSLPVGVDGRQIGSDPPKPTQSVTVRIGGIPAQVDYVGGSPGTVAGLLQLNVIIPAGVTPGPAVPVVISIAGVNSRDGVTIAVQ